MRKETRQDKTKQKHVKGLVFSIFPAEQKNYQREQKNIPAEQYKSPTPVQQFLYNRTKTIFSELESKVFSNTNNQERIKEPNAKMHYGFF
jgi:hypothetical protein